MTTDNDAAELKYIALWVCQKCLDGIKSECHTPGCALYLHRVDLPISADMYTILDPLEPSGANDSEIQLMVSASEYVQAMEAACPGATLRNNAVGKAYQALKEALSDWEAAS